MQEKMHNKLCIGETSERNPIYMQVHKQIQYVSAEILFDFQF